ncbi:Peptidase S28 family-containing protein [Aphelenchoides besseyi]|nr:Peptidase S28 family-containing protein [Aphelenchoides besseyi]
MVGRELVSILCVVATLLLIADISFGLPREFRFNRLRRHHDLSIGTEANDLTEQWFTQKLCHFNPNVTGKWKQRFWQNDQYYKDGGPQFLNIGGEGEESGRRISVWSLPIVQWAQKLNARIWNLEHRYYGKSRPTTDQSVDNLLFLNSRQALEDLADFITAKNKELNIQNPKWVVFGGSYPGALTLWFRQKHPELTVGGVGSSAPIEVVTDFFDYLRVCEDSFRTYSTKCADNIKDGFENLYEYLSYKEGRDTLDDAFGFVPKLSQLDLTYKNLQNVYMTIVGNFMVSVQYSRVNAGIFKNAASIPDVCKIMEAPSINPVQRLVKVNSYMNKQFGEDPDTTYISYEYSITELKDVSFDSPAASSRSWVWQTCNEFGYYQSTGYNGIFGTIAPVDFDINTCIDVFGEKFTIDYIRGRVQRTVDNYGRARDYNATNAVIPNGSLDPWHALGAYTPKDSSSISILINGTAHCADMEPADDKNDPQSLKDARTKIYQKLQEWTGIKSAVENEKKEETQLTARRAPFFKTKISWEVKEEDKIKLSNPMSEETIKRFGNRFIGGRHVTGGFLRRDLKQKKYANRKQKNAAVDNGSIDQKLDHFDKSDTRTFKQYFYSNSEYFDKTAASPLIFIYNPGDVDAQSIDLDDRSSMNLWAKQFGAMLYSLEHRFYGLSQPFDSMTIENLKYLTSEQALGDIANFIQNMNAQKGWKNARWIPFGGSYAGAMTAWMRATYPDLTFAAVGSSGPVQAIVDFYGYMQSIENSLRSYKDKCGDGLAEALNYAHNLSLTIEGRKMLDTALAFDVEPPFGDVDYVDQYDMMDFFYQITTTLSEVIEYTYQYDEIELFCSVLADDSYDNLDKLSIGLEAFEVGHDMQHAVDYFKYDGNSRAWIWQTCNEFGFYPSTDIGSKSAFGSITPINYFLKLCSGAYNTTLTRDELERRIDATNQRYGGARGYKATKSIQVYGTLDPWHSLGFYGPDHSRGQDVITILINGTSHCADMYEPLSTDVPDLVNARKTITNYLTKWLTK